MELKHNVSHYLDQEFILILKFYELKLLTNLKDHPETFILADSSGKKGPSAIIARPSPIHGRAGPASFSVASDVKDATPGKCDPKPECISNPLTLDIHSNQLAFPPCINIHR